MTFVARETHSAHRHLPNAVIEVVPAVLLLKAENFLQIAEDRLVILVVESEYIPEILVGGTDGVIAVLVVPYIPCHEKSRTMLEKSIQTILVVIHRILDRAVLAPVHCVPHAHAILKIEIARQNGERKQNC